jgi:uncharacterized protein YdeI (YjbR/CyaY-like superfamily)
MEKAPTIKIPSDLKKAISSNPLTLTAWKNITDVSRRDFITWIEGAKQPATRVRRISIAYDKLLRGDKRPCCYAVVPMNLYKALGEDKKAKAAWSTVSAMGKRDFVSFVEEGRDKDEKALRVQQVCLMLSKGKLHP